MSLYYRLDENDRPVPCSREEFSEFLTSADRRIVQLTDVGTVRVSTVFLGIDHNWRQSGPPILWETMIFGGIHDEYQTRCATRDEALEMHRRAVALVSRWFGVETWAWTLVDVVRVLWRRLWR